MTDISKEAVESFIQDTVKEWVLSEGLPRNADDTKDAYRTVTLLRAMSAHIAEQDAKIAKLVEALGSTVEFFRGDPASDDVDAHAVLDNARQALASIGETDD